jgi:RimJ/RimL family protein N-acetyltransferase
MDASIRTARLALLPVVAEELRETLGRLARDRADDPWAQRGWVVRRLADERAVGMLQAVFGDGGRSAEIAWLVGVPWQGQGLASEAAGLAGHRRDSHDRQA